jgi:uncharacterized protein DUF3311
VTEPDSDGTPAPGGAAEDTSGGTRRRSDYSPWNWLLAVAVVVPLLTFLFNHDSPRLFGLPMFYWLQFLFILLGVGATTVVYQVGKRRG